MRHLLHSRRCLRRGGGIPIGLHHHLPLLRPPSQVSSDADLRKCAGYALLLLGCGAATYYSVPFPADELHNKAVPFRCAPLPEDLHAVSNWRSGAAPRGPCPRPPAGRLALGTEGALAAARYACSGRRRAHGQVDRC
ncbi:unnamed protein product [Miscanthus lutarioriparius]|uniref:Uncharacterized protein n=1 Tax=Miscanthus lutarioriparius TaxID=422564 RepID=A0A811R973_9POAL|nr:unnamed protein product [Miscanthus lutarioriparius]